MVESTLHHQSLYILIMATTTTEGEAYSNPVRLSVATRESNATAGPSTPAPVLSERERLLKARKSNEVVRRKGEKWADKLMEETVDRDTFKRAVSLSNQVEGDVKEAERSSNEPGGVDQGLSTISHFHVPP
jgi:hypothetical protein